MSLLYMDGFDAGDWLTRYGANQYASTSAATRFGAGLAFNIATNNWVAVRKDFPAAAKLIVGFAFKASSFSDSIDAVKFYGDNGGTGHVYVRIMTSGAVALYRGPTQLAISAAGVCTVGAWHYLEVSATVADAGGVVTAKVDGVQVVTFTGDTKNAGTNSTIDRFDLMTIAGTSNLFDDLYVCDGTGAAPWNDFLGDVRVQLIKPSGAGSQTQLTPVGVANNWDNVNEVPASATDYNHSTTPGHRDLYAMEDIAAGTTAVLGVQVTTAAHKTDSATRSVKNLVKSGATVTASAAKVLAIASPALLTTVYQANPTTSAQWTPAEVNAMETGVEVV